MDNQSSSADFNDRETGKELKSKSKGFVRIFCRPGSETIGVVDWLTTVDHKKVGIMYGMVALICLIVGGIEALLIRTTLVHSVTAIEYNHHFTLHGTAVIILLAMVAMSAAFFNFVIPLQIGARNVALPRINTLSLWCFILGTIFLNMSWVFPGGGSAIDWFKHIPITLKVPHEEMGVSTDFWVIGLLAIGMASLLASFNFITTIINMRCTGMTMMRLPTFTWMALFTSFLLILAVSVISAALIELLFDRQFGTLFFNHAAGGNAIFWQHLFWIFGHPEVYILILPAMGIISEILPTFSRKPLWGYGLFIFSGAMVGFLSFTVWSHHIFTTGQGTIAISGFSILTMLIAIPTGVMFINLIGTLWGGRIRCATPMLFAVGFLTMLLIGGFSGIMHSTVTVDSQIHKSFFSTPHVHYILIGGNIFALLAGCYYWIPKLTGSMMSEKLGKFCFILIFIGFNLTYFPIQYLGLGGMARSPQNYQTGKGWDDPNMLVTIGAYILGFGIIFSIIQILQSVINRTILPKAGNDPWDARTLEWTIPSAVPVYNFSRTPIVKARDQHWQDKHGPMEGKMELEPKNSRGVHLPDRSWWPLFTGVGILIMGLGLITRKMMFHFPGGDTWESNFELFIIGTTITLMSILFWSMERPGGHHLQPTDHKANGKDD